MLSNDEKLQQKIDSFLRRKEAQFPELIQTADREGVTRDTYKPGKLVHWAFGTNHD